MRWQALTWSCTPATGWNRRCSTRSKPGPSVSSACWGNNDGAELRRRLPERADATLGGLRFTVVHETGAASGRDARMANDYPDTDVLVFGHSHIPWDTTAKTGLRLLNPGSPTDRRRQPFCTFMTVTVEAAALSDVVLHHLERHA